MAGAVEHCSGRYEKQIAPEVADTWG